MFHKPPSVEISIFSSQILYVQFLHQYFFFFCLNFICLLIIVHKFVRKKKIKISVEGKIDFSPITEEEAAEYKFRKWS